MSKFKLRSRAAVVAACALALPGIGAQAATTAVPVHSFFNIPDGASPVGGLVQGAGGALYGTTLYGGAWGIDPFTGSGNGTIFRVDAENVYAVVYSFTFLDEQLANVDGRWPDRALLAGLDGSLYGVAPYGGKEDAGAVFRFTPATGEFKGLHYFGLGSDDPEGNMPKAALAWGKDGRLYGSTVNGGQRQQGLGTVFSLNADGSGFGVLMSFGPGAAMPVSRLLATGDGTLYGITSTYRSSPGGALFRIGPKGWQYRVVHAFDHGKEGGFYYTGPASQVVEGGDGFLYGATIDGGGGEGSVYRVRPDGTEFKVLHTFNALGSDGKNVGGGRIETTPIFGPDGLLYGATAMGGANGTGTVYRMARDGSGFTTLYEFPSKADQRSQPMGIAPMGDIVFNARGLLCGTAYQGGLYNMGTVYCLKLD